MQSDPDVYDSESLYSLNGGLSCSERLVVNAVFAKGTDELERRIQIDRDRFPDQKIGQYADIVLAEFIAAGILDGFRKVEVPMREAFKLHEEALRKREEAKRLTQAATHDWEVAAEQFSPKLKTLGEWARSVASAWIPRPGLNLSTFASMGILGTPNFSGTPGDFAKYRDSIYDEIIFIRATSKSEVVKGRLERPVRMSDFEFSLKMLEAAQVNVEELGMSEAAAEAALESARLNCRKEQLKAFEVLKLLPEAGRWALFRYMSVQPASDEPGVPMLPCTGSDS